MNKYILLISNTPSNIAIINSCRSGCHVAPESAFVKVFKLQTRSVNFPNKSISIRNRIYMRITMCYNYVLSLFNIKAMHTYRSIIGFPNLVLYMAKSPSLKHKSHTRSSTVVISCAFAPKTLLSI